MSRSSWESMKRVAWIREEGLVPEAPLSEAAMSGVTVVAKAAVEVDPGPEEEAIE